MSNTVPSKFRHKDQIAEILENIDLVLPPRWNRKREARGFVRNERPFEHHVNAVYGGVGSALRIRRASTYGYTTTSSEESTNRQRGRVETVCRTASIRILITFSARVTRGGTRTNITYRIAEEETWADDEGETEWGSREDEDDGEHESEADDTTAEEELDVVQETNPTDAMEWDQCTPPYLTRRSIGIRLIARQKDVRRKGREMQSSERRLDVGRCVSPSVQGTVRENWG